MIKEITMKFLRIALAAACLVAFAPITGFTQPAPVVTTDGKPTDGKPVAVPTQTPQTQITTTAPVTSDTTISIGTWAGEVLKWIASAFAVVLGSAGTAVLMRMFKHLGVQVTDIMKQQLQTIIVNGLNSAAAKAAERLEGTGRIEIKSVIVADAVKYTQEHAAETIKALGLDPKSGEAVEAIRARIETAIADPGTPTPAMLTPASSPPKTV